MYEDPRIFFSAQGSCYPIIYAFLSENLLTYKEVEVDI